MSRRYGRPRRIPRIDRPPVPGFTGAPRRMPPGPTWSEPLTVHVRMSTLANPEGHGSARRERSS